ncbi:MAG: two-component system CheB/CheR fusion protein [Candidatus Latescibacterota bacterium]|jgi:two-component system CheB/CheR fusion protein
MAPEDTPLAEGKTQQTPSTPEQFHPFPIVGIGASAGGLEAFESFFDAMPTDSGMAFVLVAHLDPTHISLLPELLQKHTEMQIFQVADGMSVQPNTVHIIPPNKDLTLFNDQLQLTDLKHPRGKNLPINSFFSSLAQDQGSNAACIILSGTGTDGTLGLREIKRAGGLIIVQSEESASYNGMPNSAIATNLADFVLAPHQMPAELIRYMLSAPQTSFIPREAIETPTKVLQQIFALLRSRTSHDFSLYKENTIARRIERRIRVHQFEDIDTYLHYLEKSEHEIGALFKELLIGVTSFFRDPQAFVGLKATLLHQLKDKPADYTFRVWIPGCSTGEEAYTIAILLQECMNELKGGFTIQIFGTDIDNEAIDTARRGFYPLSIEKNVEAKHLQHFFTKKEDGYQVQKSIRDMLVFAPQNVIGDPPFTKLDLISCRNLLIYFNSELQQIILPIFHYSLKPNAILFIGSSETVGHTANLYNIVDKKWKIYTRTPQAPKIYKKPTFPAFPGMGHEMDTNLNKPEELTDDSAIQLVESILHQSNTPPCAVVDTENNILYIHGRIGRFLEPAIGKTNANILEMARPGLKKGLTSALHEVHHNRRGTERKGLRIEQDNGHVQIDLNIKPLSNQRGLKDLYMVVFIEVDAAKKPVSSSSTSDKKKTLNTSIEGIELELQTSKSNLQTTTEEFETITEELKSTNEELQSTNEELQSTNEELETSKEELQSLNEESITVNTELESRVEELVHANNDMKNLLDSTQIATLFLDIDLCIHRFTPKMTEIISLTTSDIGRPITDLAIKLLDTDLEALSLQVLDNLIPINKEVIAIDHTFFSMRILTYRTLNSEINGVVITLEDISKGKQTEEKLRYSEERYRLVLKNSPLVVAHIDQDLRYTWIHNPHPDFKASDYLGKRDDEINQNKGTKKLVKLKQQVIDSGQGSNAVVTLPLSSGDETYNISIEPLKDTFGVVIGATSISDNITGCETTETV